MAIDWKSKLTEWLRSVRSLAADVSRPRRPVDSAAPPPPRPARPVEYEPLRRVLLTDDVSRTLFEEYAGHRAGERGQEETGWVLLGVRDRDEATVLATLPAGANRDAGEAHVRFNAAAQVVGGRIVRQADRRLSMLGVVHTHPGSLRHPSAGDLRGDREWVTNLRGGEGVFGIGTADADYSESATPVAHRPQPFVQCLGNLRFTWYSLVAGNKRYQPIPVELTLGPDLARGLRPVWREIEENAERLERLSATFARVRFAAMEGKAGPALAATVGWGGDEEAIRVVLEGKDVRFFYEAGGQAFQVHLPEMAADQGVFLVMAELAARG